MNAPMPYYEDESCVIYHADLQVGGHGASWSTEPGTLSRTFSTDGSIGRAFDHTQTPRGSVQRSLFGDGPQPRGHRQTDPTTSVTAARRERGGVRSAILSAFSIYGALTDDELVAHVQRIRGHAVPGTVKTARSRLKNEGFLEDSGETRPSVNGDPMIVWRLHPSLRPTETVRDPNGRVA